MPYTLGGAVVGGLGGAATAHYTTRPKYTSYEEIIKDTKDNFEKAAKDVISDEAEQTKAINAKQAAIDAGEKWENDLKAFKEANKVGSTPELASDHELMKQRTEIQNKIKTLESATPTTRTVTKEPLSALRQNAKDLNAAVDKLKTLKAEGASEDAIASVNNRIKALQTRQEGIYNSILEGANFKGTDAEIKAAKKSLKTKLEGYTQEYMLNYDKQHAIKPEVKYLEAKNKIADYKKLIGDALADIESVSGYKLKSSPENNVKFAKEISALKEIEIRKSRTLRDILENYSKIADSNAGGGTFMERLENAIRVFNGGTVETKDKAKEIQEFIENLSKDEKKLLNGKEVSKETLEQLIKDSESRLKKLDSSVDKIKQAQTVNAKCEKIVNKNSMRHELNTEKVLISTKEVKSASKEKLLNKLHPELRLLYLS